MSSSMSPLEQTVKNIYMDFTSRSRIDRKEVREKLKNAAFFALHTVYYWKILHLRYFVDICQFILLRQDYRAPTLGVRGQSRVYK